ncbi:MAG: magnesium transporter [Endomicrobiia bacterium]|nr:magnesium transporter [Endomicrobiia bacterium]
MNSHRRKIQSWALFYPEMAMAVKSRDYARLKEILDEIHPVDIADAWEKFAPDEKVLVFKLLKSSKSIEVFEELDVPEQRHILDNIEAAQAGRILDETPSDVKTQLFWKISPRQHKKFMSLMRSEEAEKVRKTLEYPKGTAGFLMNAEMIDLKPDMTIKQALERIQRLSRSRRIENLYAFYVTDDDSNLLGGLTLRRIIALPPDSKVRASMSSVGVITLTPDMPENEVANIFSKYDLTCAPVADGDGRLMGIVVIDDVVDIIQKLNTKEIYEIGKMSSEGGEIISYKTARVFDLVRRRAGWLIFLLAVNFLSGTVLQNFEQALAAVVSLAFFIPMLLDAGGNAGAQTSITIIRGLATGDVDLSNVKKIIRVELGAAFFMAVIVGAAAFMRASLIGEGIFLALTVGLSMSTVIMVAIATGITLPLMSKKLGLDPAVLAGPITTTIVDVIGLIVYFKIAQALLPQLKNL